jgi:hypothetical protein
LVLIDAVKNPKVRDEIIKHIELEFHVMVGDVLIRPLGNAVSTQVYVLRDRNIPLEKVHLILKDIRNSVVETFKSEETVKFQNRRRVIYSHLVSCSGSCCNRCNR